MQCSVRGSCKVSRAEDSVLPPPLYLSFARSLALVALTLSSVTLGDGCVLAFFILVPARSSFASVCVCVCAVLSLFLSLCVLRFCRYPCIYRLSYDTRIVA